MILELLKDLFKEKTCSEDASVHKTGETLISNDDFANQLLSLSTNEDVNEQSDELLSGNSSTSKDGVISFSESQEFEELRLPDTIHRMVFQQLFETKEKGKMTMNILQYQVHKMPPITRTEVGILFKLNQLENERRNLTYSDPQSIAPDEPETTLRPVQLNNKKVFELSSKDSDQLQHRSYIMSVLESLYRLSLGFIAGATGAAAVYPIDLVKTRMQNQRIHPEKGDIMYKNSFDCFYKVIKYEGVRGLYRGLLPQVLGVAPEKAAKLTVNDFIRDQLKHPDGYIPLWAEFLAGACGGMSQVTFSNPVEIIKIQLQIAGEVPGGPRPSALAVFKEKFFFGLYKGASACFCRDMTFAGIYFSTYSNMKKLMIDEGGYNQPYTLFLSGLAAGAPAATFATPFDVIKTRLQVKPREGQTTYTGFRDVVKKVWKEEGWTAFWKGVGARVCRSSPQLGVTLVTYELLQRFLYFDFGGRRPEGSEKQVSSPKKVSYNPDYIGGYGSATPMITGIETQFGISLPIFNIIPISTIKEKTNEPYK